MSISMQQLKRLQEILAPLKQVNMADFSALIDELPSCEQEEAIVDLYNYITDIQTYQPE